MKNSKRYLLIALLNSLFWLSNQDAKSQDSLSYSIFLIGDAGDIVPEQIKVFDMLLAQQKSVGEKSTTIFLGDNTYPNGLPPLGNPHRNVAEKQLSAQIDILKQIEGKNFFIPGNHDWRNGKSGGELYLKAQEAFIEERMGENVFLPKNGCPGPVNVELNEAITLIIIDSQWVLSRFNSKVENQAHCKSKNSDMFFENLENLLIQNQDKQLVLAMHHPMFTYGNHGSFDSFKDHIFPLTQMSEAMYLPLPLLGSLNALVRRKAAHLQDLAHPAYKNFRNKMVKLLVSYPGSVHVSGHEHLLEYIKKGDINFIVSGSASKLTGRINKWPTKYAEAVHGFARLNFYENGYTEVEFWTIDSEAVQGKMTFKTQLNK